jgi:hypothetical protein
MTLDRRVIVSRCLSVFAAAAMILVASRGAWAAPAQRPPAGLAIAPTPEQQAQHVLDRFLAALGGRAALDAEHTTHSIGKVSAFGLSGTTEEWTARPDRSASVAKLGPFTLLEGFDGTTAWRTDPSGKLLILDGKDLEREKASRWFGHEAYLDPDHGGGKVTSAGVMKDSTGSYDVLEITPPVGNSRRLWFDPATGLLAREEFKDDQRTLISRVSDWRRAGARLMPFTNHTEIVGMSANAITVTVDSIEVNVPVDTTRFAPPASAAGGIHWLKQDGVARLPFEYRGRHVWLRASINGAPPADFLFDTGASITVLDSAYAAGLGIKTEGHMEAIGAGSSGGASFAKLQSLRVAGADGDGVELTDQKVGVLSVNPVLAPFFWRDCAGVLGFSFISQFVDEIDFDGRVLTLHDPNKFEYQGPGTKIPMTLAGTVPVVKMTLDGRTEGEYRLDVGSNSTVDVHGPFVKQHQLDQGSGKRIEITGAGFGGTFTSRVTRLERIDLGPYHWTEPLVSFSGASTGALASEDYAGNVGNQILERFKCTFDYDRHVVYLEPGERYQRRDRFTLSGMLLLRHADVVKAEQVIPGSAAEKAGIREGDVVSAIDGKAILSYEPNDLQRLFEDSEEGRKVSVELARGGKIKKVTMTLKAMI